VIPNEPIEVWTARKIAESWLSKKVNYEGEHYFNLTWLLFDKDGALFHRNLQLSELILVTGKVNAEIIASLDDTDPDQRRAALNRLLGVNLAGRDLRLANFYQAKLPKADLRNADMRGARLEEANLQEARLDNADLRWTNFSYARLQNTNLVQANLQNAKMFRTNLQNANLEKAALQYASLPNAMLLGSNLKYAHMQHAQLTGAVMLNANLAGAQLQGANLDNAYLQKAYLAKANLMMSNLENTQLQLAYLHSAQLQGVNLLRTGLQGANLAFADFSGADFTDTKVSGAIFNQTRLKLSNLAFIHRAPLTIKEYESYINKLNMKINNKSWLKGFSNEYLKIVDKPYSINFGALTEKAFCVSEQVKLGCVSYGQPATGRTIDQYDIDLSSYLLELACIDEYLVDALSNRAIEMADKFRNRMLGPLLATGLLNPHCSKAQNLSNDKREILEQRAKNLERLMN